MTNRVNEKLRRQAWTDGEDAGRAGWTDDACTYQRGTIYHDDWVDGHSHGERERQAQRRRLAA